MHLQVENPKIIEEELKSLPLAPIQPLVGTQLEVMPKSQTPDLMVSSQSQSFKLQEDIREVHQGVSRAARRHSSAAVAHALDQMASLFKHFADKDALVNRKVMDSVWFVGVCTL